jgi:hypothetical protein
MKRSSKLSVAENVNRTLRKIARDMGGGQVQIGFLADGPLSTYPDGTPVAAAAFWDEFGHGGKFPSPPRPYFRTMIAQESPGWPAKMAALAKLTHFNGAAVLKLMGEDIAGALQQSIANYNDIPLAESTLILRKKFWNNRDQITQADVAEAIRAAARGEQGATGAQAKPLVWSGQMLRAVSYEVKGASA